MEALKEYESALGICNFINALSSPDQFEIDTNKQACLLNVAAVRMAMSEYGAAEKLCTEALELDSMNIKALLRRANFMGGGGTPLGGMGGGGSPGGPGGAGAGGTPFGGTGCRTAPSFAGASSQSMACASFNLVVTGYGIEM